MNVPNNSLANKKNIAFKAILILITMTAVMCFGTGCRRSSSKPVIIWTDRAEFASYVESFNTSQSHAKAVVVYKAHLVSSLPPDKKTEAPDIVIGSWLKNSRVKKNFMTIDYMFSEQQLNPAIFYPQLLTYGTVADHQYLLPVSVNLPAVIFSGKNVNLMPENFMLSTDQIQKTAVKFNEKNKDGIYTTMGFAPSWTPAFLYLTAKMRGASFREKGVTFTWNQQILDKTVEYLCNWTKSCNTSNTAEQDFSFKYLYTPDYKQVSSGRCLFAYTTSSKLFDTPAEQLGDVDFRWIDQDGKIPVEDDIVMLGLYKESKNTNAAESFITWFLRESTQKALLERAAAMHLGSGTFGISGGFSSVKSVNEHIFPTYYRTLLGNLPGSESLMTPPALPPHWTGLKERVVIPYLSDAVKLGSGGTINAADAKPMDARISDWIKQYNY